MDSKLPDEIEIDILSRTSLKTFDTMCCTSRRITRLKYDPYFLHLHKRRNNIVSGFLTQTVNGFHEFARSHDSAVLDVGFLSPDDRIRAASEKGIIVFESPHPSYHGRKLYHVCKPATMQLFELPINPKTRNCTESVAIMVLGSKPFRYKILRLSRPNYSFLQQWDARHTRYCCEIFDSRKLSWRILDDITMPYGVFVVVSSQPITIGGSIYLLLSNNNVLKFDFYSEDWMIIPLRFSTPNNPFDKLKLIKYERNMALACKPPNGPWEIWIAMRNESWKKTFVFNEKEDTERMSVSSFYDSDTSVLVDYNTLIFYKFKKGDSVSKVVLSDMIANMFAFQSDFEPIDLVS